MQRYRQDGNGPLYLSTALREACHEIRAGYRRPLGHAVGLVRRDATVTKPCRDLYFALIGEQWLADMFWWLADERGWEVAEPLTGEIVTPARRIFRTTPGHRVQINYNPGPAAVTEIDAVFSVAGDYIACEAKSGRNSFSYGEAVARVLELDRSLSGVPGSSPASFVLALR